MNSLKTKIENFFDEILKEDEAHRILNQTFLTLSESKKYGIDSMVKSLYWTCIGDELVNGWESNDGESHLAVICVNNDDNQEHCFGEWLESAQGVIVLEPNRDNEDAITKSIAYLNSQGYEILQHNHSRDARLYSAVKFLQQEDYACINLKSEDNGWQHAKDIVQTLGGIVYRSIEAEIEDMKDCGYIVIKDGDKNSTSIIDVVNYLESHKYEVFHENHSIPEYLRNDGWYVIESDNFVSHATDIFKNMGFLVIDTNKPIDVNALNKVFEPKDFKIFPTTFIEPFINHLEDKDYIVFDIANYGSTEAIVEYLETRGYIAINSDNVNNFCIEHLTKENYFICQGDSNIESLVQLYHKEPNKFSNILQKSFKFRIDLPMYFDIDFEVKAFSLKEAHATMRLRLERACGFINNSQTYLQLNPDEIQLIAL